MMMGCIGRTGLYTPLYSYTDITNITNPMHNGVWKLWEGADVLPGHTGHFAALLSTPIMGLLYLQGFLHMGVRYGSGVRCCTGMCYV